MGRPTRLEGAIDLAAAALGGGLSTVEGMHAAIARRPFAALRLTPAVGGIAEGVRAVHDVVTGLVYATVGGAFTVVGGAARLGAGLAAGEDVEPRAGSLADTAVAVLNGFAGERLEHAGNPLAIDTALRHEGQTVALERDALSEAYPGATRRLAVFVHGLALNETAWARHASRDGRDRHTTYGSRLADDFGYTPLYVRYNTGLHISDNGRRLALLLERLLGAWPQPVDELLLVGHSMGGLVIRSAAHHAHDAGLGWVRHVRHLFFLGSPHRGAPLEKLANVTGWLLGRFDVTRPLAAVVNARSVGVKDLRFGTMLEEHWHGADLDALLVDRTADVPLLDGAAHYFISATVTEDPRHPLGAAIGDLLVRVASASGRGRLRRVRYPVERERHFGAMNHLDLLNHPDVYQQMRFWLTEG